MEIRELNTLLKGCKVIDLSHELEEHMPSFPTHSKYSHTLWESYWHGEAAVAYQLILNEHTGTHVDAPAHMIRQGPQHRWIDDIDVSSLLGPAATLNMRHKPPCSVVTEQEIRIWERDHIEIRQGDIVLLDFGWAQKWKLRPDSNAFLKDWPGLSKEGAEYLKVKGVAAVGTDAIGLDAFGDTDYPVHHVLLGSGILIMENLNNLDKLPVSSYFMAFPLKIKGGSGSPIRPTAWIPPN